MRKGDVEWLNLKFATRNSGGIRIESMTDFYNQMMKRDENGSNETAEEIIDNLINKYAKPE